MHYNASDLFTLEDVGPQRGKPEWANLRAYRRPAWKTNRPELAGPGIYALLFDDRLFYIGLFAGTKSNPFGQSVLDRWYKHITFQSLRAPEIRFSPQNLQRILTGLDGPVGDDIASCLPGGRETDCRALAPDDYPIMADGNGASSTFRKARFAARHWHTLGAERDGARLLERFTCLYHRIPENDASFGLLGNASEAERARWVKYHWLRPREAELIDTLRPICNFEIAPGTERTDVDIELAQAALGEMFSRPLGAFERLAGVAAVAAELPASEPVPQDAAKANQDDDLEAEVLAEDSTTAAEEAFRRRLNESAEIFVDAIAPQCPVPYMVDFTRIPDMRIKLRNDGTGRERVLMVLTMARGELRCQTLAPVSECLASGYAAEAVADAVMKARFAVDPRSATLEQLFRVADVAAQIAMRR